MKTLNKLSGPVWANRLIAAAAITAGVGAAVATPPASAADFYTPPTSYDTAPGAIIKSEPSPLLLQIPGVPNQWPGTAQRIMYTSRYQDGSPAPVTGFVVEPTAPWAGGGERPTVVLGPGTVGQGDNCAPSSMISFPLSLDLSQPSIGVNYTAPEMYYMLLNGVRVVVTDYIGLGTPGIHTYVNRAETGQAMLDAARAGLRISGAPADAPVAFAGYSQGGGAAASAAELASTYAPELNVKGTYAGAPPADLSQVIGAIDGTTISGAIGYAVNGLAARYPAVQNVLDTEVSPVGSAKLNELSTQCIADTILTTAFQRTSSWTATGESLAEVIGRHPEVLEVLEENRIGKLTPNAPVFVEGGVADDVIPYGQVAELVANWRALGADVSFTSNTIPPILTTSVVNHVLPMLTTLIPGMEFVLARLRS